MSILLNYKEEMYMKVLIFVLGMMVGGTLAISLHCCLILAKEADKE